MSIYHPPERNPHSGGFLFAKDVRKPCWKRLHEGTYSSARPAEFVSTKQQFSRKETSVSCREKKVPPRETFCSTQTKQKFHAENTLDSSA